MASVILRRNKTSPLTHDEMDDNITNLNNSKAEQSVVDEKAPLANPVFSGNVGIGGVVGVDSLGNIPKLRVKGGVMNLTNTSAANEYQLTINSYPGVVAALKTDADFYPMFGTATGHPMKFMTGGAERMRIDASGNVLVTSSAPLGYGPGAGGTVTQATDKYTAVTLNKPCGQITTNGSPLAALSSIDFLVYNSIFSLADCVIVNTFAGDYDLVVYPYSAGIFVVRLKNISGVSLSDALIINFAIIKGAPA